MRLRSRVPVSELVELWRAPLPGHTAHCVVSDSATGGVFASDGWGIAYPSLRLHRFDLRTGAETASLLTRHQGVGALVVDADMLWAATDKRLFRLRRDDLAVDAQWDSGLVRYTHQLVPVDGRLVMANWRAPSIGVFDPEAGTTKRLQVGRQPVLVLHEGVVTVIAGFDGGMARLDPAKPRLVDKQDSPPVVAAAHARGIWGVLASRPDRGQGVPEAASRTGTKRLVRLTGGQGEAKLSDRCAALVPDAEGDSLWCVTGDRFQQLERVDAETGESRGVFTAGPRASFEHLDPDGGRAFVVEPPDPAEVADPDGKPVSTLIAYRLPQ